MGNENSKTERCKESNEDQRFVKAFLKLGQGAGSSIRVEQFKKELGPLLGGSIWEHMASGREEMTRDQFLSKCSSLYELSPNGLIRILMPPDHFVATCFEAKGIGVSTDNEKQFVQSLLENMTAKGNDADSLIAWMNENCPLIIRPAHSKLNSLFGKTFQMAKVDSEVLNAAQIFILRCSLHPNTFQLFRTDSDEETMEGWVLLYSSTKDGLSTNRFETNVFDYKGATVAIFRRESGEIFAIAADEEWRNGTKPFGGPDSALFQFYPKFKRIESRPPAIFCNFKLRTAKLGLSYSHFFAINGEMSDVEQIEVWGCAGMGVLQVQKTQKNRQKQQQERNAKVPLPGKWDDNPDKAILELHGIQFSAERRD